MTGWAWFYLFVAVVSQAIALAILWQWRQTLDIAQQAIEGWDAEEKRADRACAFIAACLAEEGE